MAGNMSIRRAQVHVTDGCKWCKTTQNVNWYCYDCQESLCDGCFESHQRARKTKDDDVVPIKDADKRRRSILPWVCKTHSGKSCDLYCCDCKVAICVMCFTQTHTQHAFRPFDEEVESRKQFMDEQVHTLKSKQQQFDDNLSKRHDVSQYFKESVNVIRKTIETRKLELKKEIDSLAESTLQQLSTLIEEEEKSRDQECQFYEKSMKEIKQLICEAEEQAISGTSLFDMNEKLGTSVPMYDEVPKPMLPRPPVFVPGKLLPDQLQAMMGNLQSGILKNEDIGYEMQEIDNQMVQTVCKFKLSLNRPINAICPIDDTNSWMIFHECNDLIKVSKEGKIMETVKLAFKPRCLALINATEVLLTCHGSSSSIYKLSQSRQVCRFADVSPFQTWGISVRESGQVLVSTLSPKVLVLDNAGNMIKQIACEGDAQNIACLTSGSIAVINSYGTELMVIDSFGQITRTWSGKLDNGQKIKKTNQCTIANDRYDRVFLPDYYTNQVYVLAEDERKAKRFLGRKHGIKRPLAVEVDRCGRVWIGCEDGAVHVMQLGRNTERAQSEVTEVAWSLDTKL